MKYRTVTIVISDDEYEVLYAMAQNSDRKPREQAQHIVRDALGMLPPRDRVNAEPPEDRGDLILDILEMLASGTFKGMIRMLGWSLMFDGLRADMQYSNLLMRLHEETDASISQACAAMRSAAMNLATMSAAYHAAEAPDKSS